MDRILQELEIFRDAADSKVPQMLDVVSKLFEKNSILRDDDNLEYLLTKLLEFPAFGNRYLIQEHFDFHSLEFSVVDANRQNVCEPGYYSIVLLLLLKLAGEWFFNSRPRIAQHFQEDGSFGFKRLTIDRMLELTPWITTSSITTNLLPGPDYATASIFSLYARQLLVELVRIEEMPYADLEHLRHYIPALLGTVTESCYTDEKATESSLFLVVAINDQLLRKQGLESITLKYLAQFKNREIGESIVFLYNRRISVMTADDDDSHLEFQKSMTRLIVQILKDPIINDYFYTNDTSVILDVCLRQMSRVQDEELRVEYISLVPLALNQMVHLTDQG
jgi:Protein of unknown function (DUF2013)